MLGTYTCVVLAAFFFQATVHTKQKKKCPENDANCGYMCSRLGHGQYYTFLDDCFGFSHTQAPPAIKNLMNVTIEVLTETKRKKIGPPGTSYS